jgi:hypothetical protein
MRRILLFLVLLVLVISPGFTLQEQTPVHITRMEIDIWPEYDRTQVLVIYRVQLSRETPLPVRFSIRIPREAGNPFKVAMRDLDGVLYNVEYSIEPEGTWNQIVLSTSSEELYIEYYDPQLVKTGNDREYELSWFCDYPIDKMVVKIQQPRNSENLWVSPSMGLGELNPNDDLVYLAGDFGALSTGTSIGVALAYTRTGSELSASNLPVTAATPVQLNTGMGNTVAKVMNQVLENKGLATAGALILGGMILMLLVSFFAGQRMNQFSQWFSGKTGKKKLVEELGINVKYCPQCGKKTFPGDRYCRGCGNTI